MSNQYLLDTFINFLIKLKYKRRSVKSVLGLRINLFDFSSLKLRFSDSSPIIEIPYQEINERQVEEIMGTVKDITLQEQAQDRIPILLLEGVSSELRALANRPPYYMVVLDKTDMSQIMISRSPSNHLLSAIRNQIPLQFLSPYEVSAPVTGSRFFGRSEEITTMLFHPDTSYAVIGAKRIGKTSVIKELERLIRINQHAPLEQVQYYDLMSYNDIETFFERVIGDIFPREYNLLTRFGQNYATRFPDFMRRMRKRFKGPVVLLLDETHFMLKTDASRGYELTKILRTCFEEGTCRIIFAGSAELLTEIYRKDSNFNFATRVVLGNFKEQEAFELISTPMENLGVKILEREAVISTIYNSTNGHPNFIQYYCWELMRYLDANNKREVSASDLANLIDKDGFKSLIWFTFTINTNDLEKATAYAVADTEFFTVEDVDRQMKKHRLFVDICELEKACNTLKSLELIKEVGQRFKFAVPMFPDLLHQRYGADFIFEKANEYLKLKDKNPYQ